MMIKITAARRTALPAAVFFCVYYFFIFNHAFKLLPYVALAFLVLLLFILIIYFLNPSYFDPFFESTLGYILIGIIIFMFIIYAYLLAASIHCSKTLRGGLSRPSLNFLFTPHTSCCSFCAFTSRMSEVR